MYWLKLKQILISHGHFFFFPFWCTRNDVSYFNIRWVRIDKPLHIDYILFVWMTDASKTLTLSQFMRPQKIFRSKPLLSKTYMQVYERVLLLAVFLLYSTPPPPLWSPELLTKYVLPNWRKVEFYFYLRYNYFWNFIYRYTNDDYQYLSLIS